MSVLTDGQTGKGGLFTYSEQISGHLLGRNVVLPAGSPTSGFTCPLTLRGPGLTAPSGTE